MLHLLLHMAELSRPITSSELAGYLGSNPVVVRRTMAGLRDAGLVGSGKGHGGGWVLTRSIGEISLADVYRAIGSPALFAFGNRSTEPDCLLERGVNRAIASTIDEAEARILRRLAAVNLEQLRNEAGPIVGGCGAGHSGDHQNA